MGLVTVLGALVFLTAQAFATSASGNFTLTVAGGYKYALTTNFKTTIENTSYISGQGSPYYALLYDRCNQGIRGPWYWSGLNVQHITYEQGNCGFRGQIDNVDPDGGSGTYNQTFTGP